jgi:hypothetical protein
MDGWMDGWMDVMDGWMDVMDGWMDVACRYLCADAAQSRHRYGTRCRKASIQMIVTSQPKDGNAHSAQPVGCHTLATL